MSREEPLDGGCSGGALDGVPLVLAPSEAGALLSSGMAYRYRLWRRWSWQLPVVVFVMLNPSTADARADDPTIRKCVGFARRWGAGGIEVVNLFGYRATRPAALLEAEDPAGLHNDQWLGRAARAAALGPVVCAWGAPSSVAVRRLVAAGYGLWVPFSRAWSSLLWVARRMVLRAIR